MTKRPSLQREVSARRRAAALDAGESIARDARPAEAATTKTASGKPLTTTITTDWETLELLRLVAHRRAIANRGGRPSVSAVLLDLINRHRDELEREAFGPKG